MLADEPEPTKLGSEELDRSAARLRATFEPTFEIRYLGRPRAGREFWDVILTLSRRGKQSYEWGVRIAEEDVLSGVGLRRALDMAHREFRSWVARSRMDPEAPYPPLIEHTPEDN